MQETQPPESLLKYDAPIIVENLASTKKKKVAPPVEANPQQETIDFLDSLLPPRSYVDGNFQMLQHVSVTPTSRSDVIKLEEQLDALLKEKKARDKGICPIRHQLYEECMNELIREIAIELPERGAILKDIRDELDKTIAAYNELYESAVAFGIRKAIHSEQNKSELKESNDKLEKEIKAFEDKIADLQQRITDAEKNDAEDKAAKDKEHAEKVASLRAENAVMREKLEGLLTPEPPQPK
ncbi:hypothetical protein TRFO_04632 [Tritrichomonas foetus]|uniref:Uncharacterized protein n=1 Tax=Tritrichomonas foetus TaxID=1144522 RepID=A0A1J4KHC9_9EUKA|nr:hypothetical protein TRFO_04632 [Tritrichomonas foetus]|eukprot:OHT09062.1 hypothetical protein TRFO_04632 [Tritrichomonas foetus]